MDMNIIVAEADFQKAKQILLDVEHTNVFGDNLCARFQHIHFLPVDIFISPTYGHDPSEQNAIVNEEHIIFCNLSILVLTKIKAYLERPLNKESRVKTMMDHVDLCLLIIKFDLENEYGKNNNFVIVTEFTFERIHNEYYEKCNAQKKEETENNVYANELINSSNSYLSIVSFRLSRKYLALTLLCFCFILSYFIPSNYV
ncbi:unnamed protein product [Rotaria magnacalcarata]|uniref:Uncharacterized protein n=1 Tax=Rotaria magnacalcarata TaxID=392030 RepID=A0A819J897_9BILA|nr:unnamed protein product [Rotaria magnacalcarata]CAF1263515.1 unnamed protein product [Rotaria magnacalcarata]CAF1936313.1 unnamed protein product [Rotaria magnacalcarata]CAF3929001.1 unnamed protein product [Rotaria magnacalcarata]CAF4671116.1 unnamed protein product [Rotaria magnacalcarata]